MNCKIKKNNYKNKYKNKRNITLKMMEIKLKDKNLKIK